MPPTPRVERLGKYELLRHLASGGMARVYLARVDGVGGFARHLVLKTVRAERTDDDSYLAMFLDEARLVATLHHQHIAQVFDVGVAEDGTYYLAMEYVHGETVRAVLERARDLRERLPLDFSLTVVAAAAAGLHHAHERRGPDGKSLGIVHRDVTPSNVIAGYDGAVKLIDFGIAKATERATHTKTGFIKGKAGYMAPEQALGHPVDRRADVFSLGVMLYELTTQTRAFPAASELEVAHRIVRGEVTPPSVVVPGYPSELEDVVMTALARDPDERFGDAEAFGHALDYAASHLGLAPGPGAVRRVLAQFFGARPEPWYVAEREDDDEPASRTGDTASLLDSRPLFAPGPIALARGTGDLRGLARAADAAAPVTRTVTAAGAPPAPAGRAAAVAGAAPAAG
ncbi:MAG: serine/threonine protein kinase, partial [Myxococcales bacterium]|nr:serine/threonine protein kinase [Myxococcales bacterium]